MSQRPSLPYLLGAVLFGFVLGGFVVASLDIRVPGPRGPFAAAAANAAGPMSGAIAAIAPPRAAVDESPRAVVEAPAPSSGGSGIIPPSAPEARDLASRELTIPVEGVSASRLVRSYHDARTGGREHEALDILAPRNTPVIAVEDGTVAKLFVSQAGGNTIYQYDPGREFSYYYAHLERYSDGLKEGDPIHRGQVIGYVGTSGNAPKDTPHLHFAIFRLTPDKRWWEGTPIDPFDILR